MNDRWLRHVLCNLILGVPGLLIHIGGLLFSAVALGEVSTAESALSLKQILAVPFGMCVFITGRLMTLACDFLTGDSTMPRDKPLFAICLGLSLLVQAFMAAAFSQLLATMMILARDRPFPVQAGVAGAILLTCAIGTQICSDRFRKKTQRAWEECRKLSQDGDMNN